MTTENKHRSAIRKWGFDKYGISPEDFREVLAVAGAPEIPVRSEKDCGGWEWQGAGVLIAGMINPIDGSYYRQPEPNTEKVGYMHYVGIEGERDRVKAVTALLRRLGTFEDESKYGRDFI